LLCELPVEEPDNMTDAFTSEPRNAYEFMRRRKDTHGDPSLKRWNASIRMSNFTATDTSPLSVRFKLANILGIDDMI